MEESGSRIKIPQGILNDLCSRFLINIPEEERSDMVRICFQIELAHWFYIDFCRQEDLDLPPCGMQEFMKIIFHNFPFLKNTDNNVEKIYENWKRYKIRVPVFGAILLDETLTKCLLVQGFHNRASWGFPKGKVNKDEEGFDCATREVREETGFDITDYADPQDFIEHNVLDHQVRLYVVPGVPYDTEFEPKTRGEIKEIKWFAVEDLPSHKKDMTPKERLGLNPNSFFLVQPFVRQLRKWLNHRTGLAVSETEDRPDINQKNISAKRVEYYGPPEVTRQREEMQRRFQEMHRLSHPLRPSPQGTERHLLNLLGIQEKDTMQHDSPVPSPRKPPENQPEAIRKLLTGTVTSSPVTTPEKPASRLHEASHSSKHIDPRLMNSARGQSPSELNKTGTSRALHFPSSEKGGAVIGEFETHFYLAQQNNSTQNSSNGRKDERCRKDTSYDKFSTECDDDELASIEDDLLSLRDFSFRAPAWTNFSFARDQILATLPT